MSFVTRCTGSQSTLLLALPLAPPQQWEGLAVSPGVPQGLFSQGHQHRATDVRSQDHSPRTPGPALGAVEAAQILAWPSPHMHVPIKPTVAKARPVPAAGAPIVHSDVWQVLSLQSWWWLAQPWGEISALLPT